ncbi:MAG: recombination regulator RecX, partial [Pseudomonas paracarnis]
AGHLPIDAKERAKQGRFLSYRGFSMDMISRLLSGRGMDD